MLSIRLANSTQFHLFPTTVELLLDSRTTRKQTKMLDHVDHTGPNIKMKVITLVLQEVTTAIVVTSMTHETSSMLGVMDALQMKPTGSQHSVKI